jgi:hypothetical protein
VSDWTTQVADAVDSVVDLARERAVVPVQTLGRGIVYGLLAAFFLVTAFTLAAIGVFRMTDAYLPGEVWVAHFLVGGMFVFGGVVSWSRRR